MAPGIAEAHFVNHRGDLTVVLLFTGHLPAEGATLGLSSDNAALTVPASYHLPPTESRLSHVLSVDTQAVEVDTTVNLTLSLGQRTLMLSTTLLAPSGQPGMSSDMEISDNPGGDDPLVFYGGDVDKWLRVNVEPGARTNSPFLVTVSGDTEALPDWSFRGWVDESGEADASFSVEQVSRTSYLFLHAHHGGFGTSLAVTVHPGLVAIELPETTTGGESFPITFRMAGPATDDIVFPVRESWGIVRAIEPVTIPAGQSSVTIEGFVSDVEEPSQVKLSARLGTSIIISDYMTVMPSAAPT